LIAIDTNIILRFLTRQPKAQFEVARRLFRKGGLFVSVPVVMEVLDAVLRLPGVSVQNAVEVSAAIRIARQGMPFKDAFVLAFSAEADQLVTFDRAFVKRAARLQLKPKVDFP
jgi:predicted nucleic acid-binding protein